jgi:hypothetical protein
MTRPDALRRLLEVISAVPGGDAIADDVEEQIIAIDRGRRRAANYARAQGYEDHARQIEAGKYDTSPLVQIMTWRVLP